MFKYKRGINTLDKAKQVEFTLSSNMNAYLFMNATLELKKLYEGLYIKNNKVMLSNIIEKVQMGSKEYTVAGYTTSSMNLNTDEYLVGVNLLDYTFDYDINNICYKKRLSFIENENVLYIEYDINNKTSSKCKFKIFPLVTYRNSLETKKYSNLKFNQREVSNGQLINLSITNQDNIILKSNDLKFDKETDYLKNLKYEYIDEQAKKVVLFDDLFIPGYFYVSLNPNETKKVTLYISDKDFSVSEYTTDDIYMSKSHRMEKICDNIKEEYVELQNLEMAIDNFNMELGMIPELTFLSKTGKLPITSVIDIVRAVEGQYLVSGKIKEAIKILSKVKKYIDLYEKNVKTPDDETNKNIIELKLWYVEGVNRVIQKEISENDLNILSNMIKEIVENIISVNKTIKQEYMDYIDICALWYNALKIYESLTIPKQIQDEEIYIILEELKEYIVDNFWLNDKRIMKHNKNEEKSITTIYMLYCISLSYQCVFSDIPVKLLDSIFKELYTPYGLRELSKNDEKNNGYLYPKYMAHFVKANLRQNGVTRASQKIAYNLVKELITDIDRHINGGVKKIYHEKGLEVSNNIYDLLTNAEMIRLYDMLT